MTPEEIISDAELLRVHGYANFGDMTPREVVNDGVRKYAVGFSAGYTQMTILREHGLITKPKPGRYGANLTAKGKRYARSIYREPADIAAAPAASERDALAARLAAAEKMAEAVQAYIDRVDEYYALVAERGDVRSPKYKAFVVVGEAYRAMVAARAAWEGAR